MKSNGMIKWYLAILLPLILSCKDAPEFEEFNKRLRQHTFEEDLQFLRNYMDMDVLLAPGSSGLVACAAALQGRVMTSSASGMQGSSFGWINRPLFESGDTLDHINPFGGEERFWLGPEGGQYAIFFEPGVEFTLETWQTPALIDLTPFKRIEKNKRKVTYQQVGQLTNYQHFTFDIEITRSIEALSMDEAFAAFNLASQEMAFVAYRSSNELKNIGERAWTKEQGLLSIWILGMFNPSEHTTVLIPVQGGAEDQLGPIVNADYFGEIPSDRLMVRDDVIFFKGDGKYRSKIGISPRRSKNVFGAYAAESKTLTLVHFSLPKGVTDYVNSMWEMQDDPFAGDVINSYNDGPPAPGQKPLGPFYELETSSPALALAPQESGRHEQITMHITATEAQLDPIIQKLFGVSLNEIVSGL